MTNKKPRLSREAVAVSLLFFLFSIICFYFNYTVFAWGFLTIGAYLLTLCILIPHFDMDIVNAVAILVVFSIVATNIYVGVVLRSSLNEDLFFAWYLIALLGSIAVMILFDNIASDDLRILLKTLTLIVHSGFVLFIIYFYTLKNFWLGAIVFIAMDNFRRGVNELVIVLQKAVSLNLVVRYIIPDTAVVVPFLIALLYFQDILYFHLLVVFIVIALFRFSAETFIPEVALKESYRIDKQPIKSGKSLNLFASLSGSHAKINFLMLCLLYGIAYLPLEKNLVISPDFQGVVFQVSVGVIGILVAFSTFILSGYNKNEKEAKLKKIYLLKGLLGITFLFLIVSLFSFLGLTLTAFVDHEAISSFDVLLSRFPVDKNAQFTLLVIFVNEFIVFSVPAALIYFYALNKDLVMRFNGGGFKE